MAQNAVEKRKLLCLGARRFSEEVADLVSEIEGYELVGFIEDKDPTKCEQTILGLPVTWIHDLGHLDDSWRAVCIAAPGDKPRFIRQATSLGLEFATLVHPKAHVSRTATLGEGTIVLAGTVIGAGTRIGRHVTINRGCLIGHHTQIGDYATLNPGANIAGEGTIGQRSWIAMGAVVFEGITVGVDAYIAAGALLTRDVPDRVLVMGMPARIVKRWDEDGSLTGPTAD